MWASFDNYVENRRLASLLERLGIRAGAGVDVGAGYGRFARTLAKALDEVVLLEPAPSLFRTMKEVLDSDRKFEFRNECFEGARFGSKMRVILSSGVVYFYDDEKLLTFLREAKERLSDGGVLILRDFISPTQSMVVQSSYVKGQCCYYRSTQDWANIVDSMGFRVEEMFRSKPRLRLLRNRYIRRVLGKSALRALLNSRRFRAFWEKRDMRLNPRGSVQTSFIVLRLVN